MKKGLRKGLTVLMSLCLIAAFLPMAGGEGTAYAAKSTKSVHLNKTSVRLIQGNKLKLKVKGLQKNAKTGKKPKIKWKSANSKIASVSKKGKVKAKSGGQTVITATIKYSKKKQTHLTCKVNVIRLTSHNASLPRAWHSPSLSPPGSE